MKTFKDNAGRGWSLAINVATVKRVREMLKVDLLSLDMDLVDKLASDPVLLCDVLYVVLKPDADKAGVSDIEFGQAMAGDAIAQATEAFLEELVDFFPKDRRRVIKQALTKVQDMQSAILNMAEKQLSDPALDAQIKDALSKIGEPSGKLPEPLASAPTN